MKNLKPFLFVKLRIYKTKEANAFFVDYKRFKIN